MTSATLPDFFDVPVRELAARLRDGSLTSEEVVAAYIARATAVQARLNPIAVPLFESALATARSQEAPSGALGGVPISIKEQFLVAGTPTTWGLVHRAAHRAEREGTVLGRLRAAGAIPIAKSNVPQLLLLMETDNALYGRTNNPWKSERTPGGSSGGEACLVAARGTALGLGGDLGGSIRVPAHFCGVHGFAPSEGRLPLDDNPTDILPPAAGFEPRIGPIARHVDDLVLAMSVLAPDGIGGGSDATQPPIVVPASVRGVRVGWFDFDGYFPASPAIRRAAAEAAGALTSAGADVVRFDPPGVADGIRLFLALGGDTKGMARALGGEKPDPRIAGYIRMGALPSLVRPVVRAVMRATGQSRLAAALGLAASRRLEGREELLARLRGYRERFRAAMADAGIDVILCPPYATPAFRHGQGDQLSIWSAGSYATLFSILGFPAGVVAATRVRLGEESDRTVGRDPSDRAARDAETGSVGLPVGVQVAAPTGQDGLVLAVMSELERYFRAQRDYPLNPEVEN